MFKRVSRTVTKAIGLWRLLLTDSETFGRNMLQLTNPNLFQTRLVDMLYTNDLFVECLAHQPKFRLNVLDPAWSAAGMTGGPNTVVALAFALSRRGIPIRFVTTVERTRIDSRWLIRHGSELLGERLTLEPEIGHAGDPNAPLSVGEGDIFLATHWSTAQQLKSVLPKMNHQEFFYMIQDFEPGFYPWSSNYASAIDTYSMNFWPIINERFLAEYLFSQPFGQLPTAKLRERALVFEPAVDRTKFYPRTGREAPPKRVLFYARPTNPRNMFGLGLSALREVAGSSVFAGWEFIAIGSRGSLPELSLGHGRQLRAATWSAYGNYGDMLRDASVLLCPMLSPHTSYPVLEMAACGGLVVTNVFANKTAQALEDISSSILGVEATVAGFVEGLLISAGRVNAGETQCGTLTHPSQWTLAFDDIVERIAELL